MAYKHIVCVVDGSQESAKAQEGAAGLARENKSKLTYIFLADTAFLDSMATLTRGGDVLGAGMENIGNLLLDKAQTFSDAKGVTSDREVLKGKEQVSLVDELIRLGADLLVTHLAQGSRLLDIDKNDLESNVEEIKKKTGIKIILY